MNGQHVPSPRDDDPRTVVELPSFLAPAYWTLQRARRMLDDLRAAEARHPRDDHAFTDRLPYVLDLLDGVTRLINDGSKGNRTQLFADWWQTADRTKQNDMHELRIAELKRAERRTSRLIEYHIVDTITVISDDDEIRTRLTRPDGSTHDVVDDEGNASGVVVFSLDGGDHPNNLPASPTQVSVAYRFAGGIFDGKPVVATLEDYWTDLHDRVLPTAAKLLVDDGD